MWIYAESIAEIRSRISYNLFVLRMHHYRRHVPRHGIHQKVGNLTNQTFADGSKGELDLEPGAATGMIDSFAWDMSLTKN